MSVKHLTVSAELLSVSSERYIDSLRLQTALLVTLRLFCSVFYPSHWVFPHQHLPQAGIPRPWLSPALQLVLSTHLSVVVRDMAETKGCSSTFTFCFIFIRQYKFCLRALRISQVGTLITWCWRSCSLNNRSAGWEPVRCWQGVSLLRFLSWLADSCLLCVPTWPFSVNANPLVSVPMRTLVILD